MSYSLLGKVKRAIRKPPGYIAKRLWIEACRQIERKQAPRRAKNLSLAVLLTRTVTPNIMTLWQQLAARAFFANTEPRNTDPLQQHLPREHHRIVQQAENALSHQVDLLGSGLIELGETIDWHKDYKSGHRWPPQYCHDIAFNNLDRPSDVKFPWELSRMQWMIPLGQAYLLIQDERYAHATKQLIQHWIEQNPYAMSVNWSCTMDVALRMISWIWFFYVFNRAESWQDAQFQQAFLCSLYLHGDFISRHLEFADVNANHFISDAAGLVFAGLFFSDCNIARQWQETGWRYLCDEMLQQTSEAGVNFEASIAYHRLATELFLFPALYRQARGLGIDAVYQQRLIKMAYYIAHYTRQDGSVPLLGDADDGRVLPFSMQPINDHRYLIGFIANAFDNMALMRLFSGPLLEHYWLLQAVTKKVDHSLSQLSSTQFEPGYYIMRNEQDHIFIDCAPVGMRDKGGHGHNDCLSFTAALSGETLIEDRGCYLYTADAKSRNTFRGTASHNTPMIDEVEINRFIGWDFLWDLKYEAKPVVLSWQCSGESACLIARHTGYYKLDDPVSITRKIQLNHDQHQIQIEDTIEAKQPHDIMIPLHLASGVVVLEQQNNSITIIKNNKRFTIKYESDSPWHCQISESTLSPTYGIQQPSQKIQWTTQAKQTTLLINILT